MKTNNISEQLICPFDCDLIMKKQRSLKRNLLVQKDSFVTKKIAILGGSTTTDIKNILDIFLLNYDIKAEFYESEYNKYYEDSMFSNVELETFQPDIIFIFTSMVNLLYKPLFTDSEDEVSRKLEKEYIRYENIWECLDNKYHAIIVQNNMELPYYSILGNLDTVLIQGERNFIERLNDRFSAYARTHKNFYIHDIHYLAAQIGLERWHNRFQYYAYKFAINYDVVPLVAHSMANMVKSILGKSKKCLVLDLDNTLWGGIIGDDGLDGLQIGKETPQAEAYTEFQEYVLKLKQRGVILAVCSKNDEDIAKTGFEHPDSILKVTDFISFKANWEPKHLNIKKIAEEINIGLDSLVFIDDNPVERQIVKESLPMVSVPEVDSTDVFSYIRAIEENGYFEAVVISQDDLRRNQTYMENKQRNEVQLNFKSYDEFLKSLEMVAEIRNFQPIYFERIAQLTNKSNQFNLTTRRYTLAEIEIIAKNPKYITLYGRLKDKFGDNGLVSVIIGEIKGRELHIDLWLMSCRVLKRNMEHAMLDQLVNEAKQYRIETIVGYYYKTKKNEMVAALYKTFGFTAISQKPEETVWSLDILQRYQQQNHFIQVQTVK